MKRTLKELQELWDKLGDIPVNNDDEIEEDFLNFPAGTSKFDVWHWFDERCPNGVAEDLMRQCYDNFFKSWHEEYEYWADDESALREELHNNQYEDRLYYKNGDVYVGQLNEIA